MILKENMIFHFQTMIEKYNKLLSVDWSKVDLNVGGFKENPSVEPACAGGVCLI